MDSGEGELTCDQFLPFSNVMSDTHRGWPEICFLDQLWEASRQDGPSGRIRRQIRNAVTELNPMNERVKFSQRMHFYIDLFMWIWKISTFSPDVAVTWEFCPNEFSLCLSECMLDECYDEQPLYLYLEKKLPKDIKIQAKASSNRISMLSIRMTLTSMYTKVLT